MSQRAFELENLTVLRAFACMYVFIHRYSLVFISTFIHKCLLAEITAIFNFQAGFFGDRRQ